MTLLVVDTVGEETTAAGGGGGGGGGMMMGVGVMSHVDGVELGGSVWYGGGRCIVVCG